MRCPDCSKFVSLETEVPDGTDELEVTVEDGKVVVRGSVRVVRTCADCSTELKEASFEVDAELEQKLDAKHTDHELLLEGDLSSTESGGGRYAKNMVGFEGAVTITCSECNDEHDKPVVIGELELHDELPASAYDELV